jgi:hypothetical protein
MSTAMERYKRESSLARALVAKDRNDEWAMGRAMLADLAEKDERIAALEGLVEELHGALSETAMVFVNIDTPDEIRLRIRQAMKAYVAAQKGQP